MRSNGAMNRYEGQSRSLVARGPRRSVARKSHLAVTPPRTAPLTLKARRSFAKLTWYTILASIFAISGYAYRDPDMRKALDYQMTLLVSPGISAFAPNSYDRIRASEPLPAHASYLFTESQKGPRAHALVRGNFHHVSKRKGMRPVWQRVILQCTLSGLKAQKGRN